MLNNLPENHRHLILIELNEINFDLARKYIARYPGKFKAFEMCYAGKLITTSCEKTYELLEPWIQWPSVHTGKSYTEHNIFRLGDVVKSRPVQVFEELENAGFLVGAISAMNASNTLKAPAYFVPDPWTKTPADSSFWSSAISSAVSQAVNDNASSKLTLGSVVSLCLALIRFASPKYYFKYLSLALRSRGASWRKALFLDLFLHDFHAHLFGSKMPAFSTLFLNAGAHIQHHYFFNSLAVEDYKTLRNPDWYVSEGLDPFHEMIEVYDLIIRELMNIPNTDLIIATGLSQKPYDRVKYYYRLKDHERFLTELGIEFKSVAPRMTRDFLVEFDSVELAAAAERKLLAINVVNSDELLFGEIDNRGDSLFVTLTFPSEVNGQTQFKVDGISRSLSPHVSFVAIKNGMHQEKGFAYFSPNIEMLAPEDGAHVKEIYFTIKQYFGIIS